MSDSLYPQNPDGLFPENPTGGGEDGGGGSEIVAVTPGYRIIDTAGVSNWTGDTPFSLVDGGNAVIVEQDVVNPHKVWLVINGNNNPGPYFVTDGVLDSIRLPAVQVSGFSGSMVTVTTGGSIA